MLEPALIAAAVVVCLLAAVLKGAIGFGLPLLAVSGMAVFLGTRNAVLLITLPILVSNAWILVIRPVDRVAIRRLLPLLAAAIPSIVLGAQLLAGLDVRILTVGLGLVALTFASLSLVSVHLRVPPSMELPASVVVGAGAGLLSGATSVSGPLLALYLSGLDLAKRPFVYAITLVFTVQSVVQIASYAQLGLFTSEILILSALLVVPVMIGQQVGLAIQDRLDADVFRRVVLVVVGLASLNLIARGLGLY